MIIVCPCGQKSRIKDLTTVDRVRCSGCKRMLGAEAHRQAARNANIVLELAALLMSKDASRWTHEEETIARVIHAHEVK